MELNNIESLGEFEAPSFFKDNGYTVIRIPGIVSLSNGDMIVYYECRRGGDWSPIDIGMTKSRDGGKTWSETIIAASGMGRNTMNNPCMISDGEKVHFFYCENYKRLFYSVSVDAGESFSPSKELTDDIDRLSKNRFWSVLACGPGHGLRLKDGSLIIPMWFACNKTDMFAHHPSFISVLRIEKGCKELHLSKRIDEGTLVDPSECCVAETGDGKLVINIRNENKIRRRSLSFSSDGGKNWTDPVFCEDMPDPVCCAGMCEFGEDILFTNCSSETARENLTLKRFNPSIKHKESLLISSTGGYSDVCFNPVYGKAFVAFENETNHIKIAEIEI
ncbi:MAG: exo-alpha-sialidase [Clostridia bacterium]|nr:exo-alpha-sialidase [Clostridia bacterium]